MLSTWYIHMKHDKILPKKYVDPKKGLSYYLSPKTPRDVWKKGQLILITIWTNGSHTKLQHMNVHLQITPKS
jgi:hypothetical protein